MRRTQMLVEIYNSLQTEPLKARLERVFAHIQQYFFTLEKYSGDLKTELVWYSNGRKEVGCQIVWFLNAF